MGGPARTLSKDDALDELLGLQSDGLILLEGAASPDQVSLDGWDPSLAQKSNGNVGGVVIRYLSTGTLLQGSPSGGSAPDRLDPRNALALIRFCQWLNENYGVTELYHLGIAGGGTTATGEPRVDCHGQGRAVDFCGVRGNQADGGEFALTVWDNWGTVSTTGTPGGDWPEGTGEGVSFRLDDPEADQFTAGFFRDAYQFITSEWQDRSEGPDDPGGSAIGEHSFVMNPDHPTSAPGTAHGREAHRNHLHMQIGKTGTE
jgi:hypothetical protein